ncbi:hypothetical protein GMI70_10190 [Eggerthellaceae bacterium zg-893]|nr:hypothetical protein [Eggerthellaceae bacterium zg-893]
MAIDKQLLRRAVESLSDVEGVFMDPKSLVEDVFLLAYAFPEEADFMAACASTARALNQLARRTVTASELKYAFAGWKSYHYQHRVGQGVRATCRIMFREIDGGVEVKGFGHRRIPSDFYQRMSEVEATSPLLGRTARTT